jgi:sterol desaturase/sphingolipid hydroxylase (fatty acid hydroxylase superfamily)
VVDDAKFGERDRRGYWRPFQAIVYPPVFVWPPRPAGFLKWLFGYPGYLLPWNVLYLGLAILVWTYASPALDSMRDPAIAAMAWILARNIAIVCVFYGVFHVRLYVRRAQGVMFKYNAQWPETDNRSFVFRGQTRDNIFWTLVSGVPVWSAYEILTLWAMANGVIPTLSWAEHPVYFIALLVLLPLFREIHFYLVHRLIHWRPLYRTIHKLHHKNANPGPWSGLAMHPVEHVLYFSGVLILWIVPAHPLHVIFQLLETGLSPAPAHAGFDRMVVGEGETIETHCYAHYLHHKYFNCNYADGAIPLDRWFGSFNDGTRAPK